MKNFLARIKNLAKKNPKKIVFPEGTEERTLKAIEKIVNEKIAKPILIGKISEIEKKIKQLKLKIDAKKIIVIDPEKNEKKIAYTKKLFELRKDKGMTKEQAEEFIRNELYFGLMMLKEGHADGLVGGTLLPTSETLRPTLQIIKTKEKFHKVSGVFFMLLKNRLLLFADCVVNIEPNSRDLADIAIDTAQTAKKFGIKPHVAFLSFSTLGSSKHPANDKIREAVAVARDRRPDILFEGELQVDAALVPQIAKRKCPQSRLAGKANVLIFPNLNSGNIAYKLVERLAKAHAIGPFLQGLNKPVNDLSRGCSVEDIVNATIFTVYEAGHTSHVTRQ